jgi:hypothetical protein
MFRYAAENVCRYSPSLPLHNMLFADFAKMVTVDSKDNGIGEESGMPELSPNQKFPIVRTFFAYNSDSIKRAHERKNMVKFNFSPYPRRLVLAEKGFNSLVIRGWRINIIQNLPVSCLQRVPVHCRNNVGRPVHIIP